MKKIEVGKKYKNLHTGQVCEAKAIVFYNIGYLDDNEPQNIHPHYCHYKTFQKHWAEMSN